MLKHGVVSPCRRRAALLLVALLAAALPAAAAQVPAGTVGGTLVAQDSRAPIEGARVTILGTALATSTDSLGRFEFSVVPAGVRVVQARAVGFAVGSWVVQLTVGQVFRQVLELESFAVEMPGVTVSGEDRTGWRTEAAFEARRQRETGYFITREEIAGRRAETLTDLLRGVPGVMTTCRGRNCQVLMSRATRSCSPEYFLDGHQATFSTGPSFPIIQIRGVEIYRSSSEVPAVFQRFALRCGVIAIWTVEPGESLNRPRPYLAEQRPAPPARPTDPAPPRP